MSLPLWRAYNLFWLFLMEWRDEKDQNRIRSMAENFVRHMDALEAKTSPEWVPSWWRGEEDAYQSTLALSREVSRGRSHGPAHVAT